MVNHDYIFHVHGTAQVFFNYINFVIKPGAQGFRMKSMCLPVFLTMWTCLLRIL